MKQSNTKLKLQSVAQLETLIIYKHCELQTDVGSQKISSSKKKFDLEVFHYL